VLFRSQQQCKIPCNFRKLRDFPEDYVLGTYRLKNGIPIKIGVEHILFQVKLFQDTFGDQSIRCKRPAILPTSKPFGVNGTGKGGSFQVMDSESFEKRFHNTLNVEKICFPRGY